MIVLDTNVISEMMKPRPNAVAIAWIDAQQEDFWTSAVTLQEIVYGISRVKDAVYRDGLQRSFDKAFPRVIADRILPLDDTAARSAGLIMARRQLAGAQISVPDAQIAAIVQANSATLATRDVSDFAGLGLSLVNPWEAA
ncbi:MAG: type II toxin-antitoxin system VapC family toxin [Alphaproteobacteria bacterium]|nr:type II toxin-antitoxin system VapC family toxin [Alphaproteobacteria bacterium]